MSTKQKEASKLTSKRIKSLKDEKALKDTLKTVKPIFDKKEGMLKELSIMQFEDATSGKNVGKGLDKKPMSSIKKIADAAADEKQLTRTARKLHRDVINGKKYGETDLL